MKENPEISWRFQDFFLPLPSRNIIERFAPGAVKDARVTTQGIFLCSYFRDLPKVSSGHRRLHPSRYKSSDKVYDVSRQGLQSLSVCPCPWGEGSDGREASVNVKPSVRIRLGMWEAFPPPGGRWNLQRCGSWD